MTEHITFFVYGLCVMFYSMMVWMFYRKNKEKLSRLITCLMVILDMECLKDLFLFVDGIGAQSNVWYLMNAIDMVIIPFYIFILMELVKPGWLTWRKGIIHEAVFLLPLALYAFTYKICWFDLLTGLGALYGTVTYILMFFLIARYQRQLKERFSYQENINLHWLRGILTCFFVILVAWTISCYMIDAEFDNVYMLPQFGIKKKVRNLVVSNIFRIFVVVNQIVTNNIKRLPNDYQGQSYRNILYYR